IWLSPTGRVLDATIFTIWVVQIAVFILLILGFVFRSTRGQDIEEHWQIIYTAVGIFLLVGLISIPIGNLIARPLQQRGYEEFVQENELLIEAIEAYTAETGSPPNDLESLYPDYLSQPIAQIVEDQVGDEIRQQIELQLPYDSIDGRSAEDVLYSYKPPTENAPWQLQVSIYLGSFQSTRFVYNPEEKYSNRYRAVGRWGVAQ
ncbi:MAG: hypothetical protein AAGD96_36670, partial [Chloroflexota bacterium]